MLNRSDGRLVPVVVTCFALLAPAAASAEVTTSQITAPADGAAFIDDDTVVTESEFTVSGTSDGTTTDVVDIQCTTEGFGFTLADDVAVDAAGAFSTTVQAESMDDDACVLRAVDGTVSPDSLTRFRGPRVAVAEFSTSTVFDGPNAGAVYDYEFDAQGSRGFFDLDASGDNGIDDSDAYSTSFETNGGAWQNTATFERRNEDSSGPRAGVQVDGRNAYSSYSAATLFGDGDGLDPDSDEIAGFPALTVTTAVDSATGDLTLTEASALVRCPADSVSPTFATCGSFEATGVRLERTWVVRQGMVASVTDVFRSTDGAAHAVSPHLNVDSDSDEIGWRIGDGAYDRYEDGDVLGDAQLPDGPFVLTRREIDDEPAEGPEGEPGSVVFHQVPQEIRFLEEEQFDAVYADVAVPAGGTGSLAHTFTVGFGERQAYAAAVSVADGLEAPVIAIDTPAEGATVTTDNIVVAGTVSDLAVDSVTVNGIGALVGEDGSWAAVVPLAEGANTLTAIATDSAGQTGQATRNVTYVEPAEPARVRVAPAGVTRKLTPRRDRSAPFKFRVAGQIVLPQDVGAGEACNGNMLVVVRAGSRILAVKSPPVLGNCEYRTSRMKFGRKAVGKGRKKLTVAVRFTGNAVLAQKKAAKATFRIR